MSDERIVVRDTVREVVTVVAPGPRGPQGPPGGSDEAALEEHIATEPAHGGDLAGDPRPPEAHIHPQTDVVGLAAALAVKQDASTAATDTELAKERSDREAADGALSASTEAAQATANAALPKAGGTMSGPLTLASDPTTNLQPATKQFVAAQIAALINGAPASQDTLKELADQMVSDESALAALAATVSGKLGASANLSDLVNAVAARANLGLGSAATQSSGAFDASGAATAAQAASQPVDSDLTAIAALGTTAFGRELLTLASAAKGREKLEAAAAVHSHAQADVTGLVEALAGKAATTDSRFPQVAALTAAVGPIKEQTALQPITGLGLAIGASSTEMWRVTYWLLVEAANATMDLVLGFTVPTGCTMRWGPVVGNPGSMTGWGAIQPASTPGADLRTELQTLVIGTRAGQVGVPVTAVVFGGGNAGTVQIQYAQSVSDSGNLKPLKGSVMEALKVAS